MRKFKVGDIVTFSDPGYRMAIPAWEGDEFRIVNIAEKLIAGCGYEMLSVQGTFNGLWWGEDRALKLFKPKPLSTLEDLEALYAEV